MAHEAAAESAPPRPQLQRATTVEGATLTKPIRFKPLRSHPPTGPPQISSWWGCNDASHQACQMGEVVAGARANPLPPRAAWAFKDGKPAEAHCRTRPLGDHCNCFPGTYYTNKAKVLGRLRLPVRSDNCW